MSHDDEANVAIVGGGCVGTSIALHLTRLGCKEVLLLERGHLAWGATGKSSAIVNVGVWNASQPLVKMLLESIDIYRNFAQQIGGSCGFHPTGWIGVAGKAQEEKVKKTVAAEKSLGANSKLLTQSEISAIQPGTFTEDLTLAVYEPLSGYADPVETTNSYGKEAEKLGAKIITGVNVTRITNGGQTKIIETDKGQFKANKVVMAANVWAPKLVSSLGVSLPITPTRKQVCLFKLQDTGRPRIIMDDFVGDLYIKPEGDQTLVGEIESPGLTCDPDNFPEGLDSDMIPKLAQKLVHRLPAMNAAVSRGGYSGPYDVSPDDHPILDELPGYDGIYCAVGFSGHGFRFSPCTGRLMAEFVVEGKSKGVDIREFRLSRFAEGKSIAHLA